ncbi:hypothetical protein N7462_000261 [Penicillium macrosclerotiorum]|uniref:uncharacterized protein n=1 Tax=Penicillium macrosclerotiorum TaxID=303699 RepID=UPI002547AD2D|nr:uncharacterized protein N7462_000261 [Penicillium macrosclerotiorum]KAJ5698256.1 hypothetical protein N7462_000261 [Penicillium macrosclerotiorum]
MQSCHPAACIDCPSTRPNPLCPGIDATSRSRLLPRISLTAHDLEGEEEAVGQQHRPGCAYSPLPAPSSAHSCPSTPRSRRRWAADGPPVHWKPSIRPPQSPPSPTSPQSMFLTVTATCMFGLLPGQSPARLFDGSKPAETKPCAKDAASPDPRRGSRVVPPRIASRKTTVTKSREVPAKSQVGEALIVPPVLSVILGVGPQMFSL